MQVRYQTVASSTATQFCGSKFMPNSVHRGIPFNLLYTTCKIFKVSLHVYYYFIC